MSVGQPGAAGRMLPPEFVAFGISEANWRPWTPADSLGILRAMSFKLSWGWTYDLQRAVLMDTHPELAELVDDLVPFASNVIHGSEITVIDESDLKEWGLYSEESLLDRYEAAKEHVLCANPFYSARKECPDPYAEQKKALLALEEAEAARQRAEKAE